MSKLEVKLISKKRVWENFIYTRPEANFLQSWNWGSFHKSLGKRVFRLGLFEDKKIKGCVLVVKEVAKRGSYFAVAGGPIIDWEKFNQLDTLIQYIKHQALTENCSFIRLRPQVLDTFENRRRLVSLGFRLSPIHLTADLTVQLDLEKSEEELLKEMRKNTRYEIRKASRIGVKVKQSRDPNDIKIFYKHQIKLAQKHKFVPFSFDFLHQQFKAFVKDNQAVLFHAYKDGVLLASAYVIFYNREAVYHYGISTPQNSKLPGSYACLWEAICKVKKRGMTSFNLWGVAPKDQHSHRFAGVSLFKRGFGGKDVKYLPTHDLPLNWKYYFTFAFELIRGKYRRL